MHVFLCVHATRKEPIKFYQQLIYAPNLKGRHYIRIATAVIACLVDAMSLKTTRITEKVSGEQTDLRAIEACVERRKRLPQKIYIFIYVIILLIRNIKYQGYQDAMSLQTTGASRESSLMSRQTLLMLSPLNFSLNLNSQFLFLLIATILKIHLEHLSMLLIVKTIDGFSINS